VEQALRDIHFPIDPAKGIKKQVRTNPNLLGLGHSNISPAKALDAIRALKEASLPFDRAEMRVHIRMPADTAPLVWELGGKGRVLLRIAGSCLNTKLSLHALLRIAGLFFQWCLADSRPD